MPSLGDGAFIFVLALLLFGPKKLPELARQVGKLMAEFRRASNEFRMQMEEELRVSEQEERQKKLAALEASAPPAALLDIPEPEHPHLPTPMVENHIQTVEPFAEGLASETYVSDEPAISASPEPIATSGDLHLMPPATGLPVARSSSSLASAFESIPHTPDPEASLHG